MDGKDLFPGRLCRAYAGGAITRRVFIATFGRWQKENGRSFDCRGSADAAGVRLSYRGFTASVSGGRIRWLSGSWRDRRGRSHPVIEGADSVFEFRRKVDFALREEGLMGGAVCRESLP